jgi:hypothetical protein
MTNAKKMSFGRWLAIFMLAWVVFDLIVVGSGGLFFSLSPVNLLRPFILIFWCGVVAAVLMYWARESGWPGSIALRFGLATAAYFQCFGLALLFSASSVAILSRSAWIEYAPTISIGSIFGGIAVYFTVRKKLGTRYLTSSPVDQPPAS